MKINDFEIIGGIFKKGFIALFVFFFLPNIGYSQTENINLLLEKLKDEQPFIRGSAAETLGAKKSKRAIGQLIDALLKDNHPYVRGKAAEALGKLKDVRAVDSLIYALYDNNPFVREKAIEALGVIKNNRAIEPLITVMKDKEPMKNIANNWALHLVKNIPDDVIRRHRFFDMKATDFQWRAAEALANIGSPAVESLIAYLKNEDLPLRREAAEALGKINDTRASAFLLSALKEKNLFVIAGAYSFFIRKGVIGSEPTLIEALNKHGFREMAEAFLNCGNFILEDAGRNWAIKNNYIILPDPKKAGPKWGKIR